MNTLLLVRHGESEWNKIGRIQGQQDTPLTANGVNQAHAVADRLRAMLNTKTVRIYSSPLSRAQQTAEIIAKKLSINLADIQVEQRLNDFNLGEISGTLGWDKVAESHPELARLRLEDPMRFHPPGGESGAEFSARLENFVEGLPDDDVFNLIVSHGVANKFIRSIRRNLTGSDIIALGEGQDTIYQLKGDVETEIAATPTNQSGDAKKDILAEVDVRLGERSYQILIGPQLLHNAENHLRDIVAGRRIALISDDAILDHYLDILSPQLDRLTYRWDIYRVRGGEEAKSFSGLEKLLNNLLGDGIDRNSVALAFGGGVVGDVAGFAAALLMRGIELIQIPTTLMSQVDSAVGGKNAINTHHGKNLVGTFLQPRIVLNDVTVLKTLPMDEFRSGYGEIIKYGLLRGESEFAWLEENVQRILQRDEQALVEVIRMGCETKADIVSEDELDKGKRALVNLGHTFAHAFETHAGFGNFTHGNAVAVGVISACKLSESLGVCESGLSNRVIAHTKKAGLPVSLNELSPEQSWNADQLYADMQHDKKTLDGNIHFIVLSGIGAPFVKADIDRSDVIDTLRAMGAGIP
ncbi:MAG: 3-dehydroquinate synthase [Gammaproteobacteria bacterium]|nr:3-dehydroquinate synthase [Gammaproteobacteria bacterium]